MFLDLLSKHLSWWPTACFHPLLFCVLPHRIWCRKWNKKYTRVPISMSRIWFALSVVAILSRHDENRRQSIGSNSHNNVEPTAQTLDLARTPKPRLYWRALIASRRADWPIAAGSVCQSLAVEKSIIRCDPLFQTHYLDRELWIQI